MRWFTLAVGLILILGLGGSAAADPSKWVSVAPPALGFSIDFPDVPETRHLEDTVDQTHRVAYSYDDAQGALRLSHHDVDKAGLARFSTQEALYRLRDAGAARVGAVVNERLFEHAGHWYLESDIVGGEDLLRVRLVFEDNRAYMIMAASSRPWSDAFTATAQRFMDSFSLR